MHWAKRVYGVGAFGLALGLACLTTDVVGAPRQSTPIFTPSQQAAPVVAKVGTGLISGKVVDSFGSPVSSAIVSLGGGLSMVGLNTQVQNPTQAGQRRVLTNGDGRFVFFDLPAGPYSLDVTKPGYSAGAYGRLRPGGIAQSLDLRDGQRTGDITIPIWKFAAISGVITDETGDPAVNVQVWALKRVIDSGKPRLTAALGSASATTDDRGVFRIPSLTAGEYVVCLHSSTSTMPVDFADAYQVSRQDGSSAEWSRQLSANGASSVLISPLSPGYRVGDRLVQISGNPFSRSLPTPGPQENGRLAVYPTIFYPGTFSATQAQPVVLGAGEERAGVMLQLRLVPAVTVGGDVVGPDGPVARVGVRLISTNAIEMTSESGFETAGTVTDARGRFEFMGVPPGQYTIRVLKTPPALPRPAPAPARGGGPPPLMPFAPPVPEGPTLWANQQISVGDTDVRDLTVSLNRGVRVSGRFEFDGTSPTPAADVIQSISLQFLPADGRETGSSTPMIASIDAGGRVSTYEIPPGRYILRYAAYLETRAALGSWLFRNATLGGRDISSLPFDLRADGDDLIVTMTDHPTELTGTVRDAQGRPDPNAAILIVTTNREGWSNYATNPVLIRTLRPGKDGVYKLVNFIPGEYYAVAIPEGQAGDWQDPKLLEAAVRDAVRFTIGAGEKKTQDIVTRPVR